jgi:hypothetical protein
MSSEVFLNGNVAFLLPFLIDLLIVYTTVKKIFNLHKKFPEKNIFFNFFIEKSKKKISAEIFFRFFSKISITFHLGVFRLFGHTVLCFHRNVSLLDKINDK